MRAHRWIWCLAVAMTTAAIQACTPQVTGGEGVAAQAAEEADEGGCDTAPTCTGVAVGDGTTCALHEDLLAGAQAACAADGMIAVELYLPWDCGDAGSRYAKVICCDEGEPATVPTEPPDPPDPGSPTPSGALGDGVTCLANSEYEQMATDTCTSLGLSLIDLYTANDCSESSSRAAKYVCGQAP